MHFLILHNCRLDQTGGVDFQAANVKSSAHLRVKRKYDVFLLKIQCALMQKMRVKLIGIILLIGKIIKVQKQAFLYLLL